jgi:hypothetical protein
VGASFLRLEDTFHLAPDWAPSHPYLPILDIEDNGPMLAMTDICFHDPKAFIY